MHERTTAFVGFPRELPRILAALREKNSREWYAAHRHEYASFVTEPLRTLGEKLEPLVLAQDDRLELKLSRIHRDLRFSASKLPYRTEAWFVFRRSASDWIDTPAFFLEVSPGGTRWGMGFYGATARTMEAVRQAVVERARDFARAQRKATEAGFCVNGEHCRRARRIDANLSVELADLCQRRNVYFEKREAYNETFYGPGLVDYIARDFESLHLNYRLLRDVSDHLRN